MNPLSFALRRPITIIVLVVAVLAAGATAIRPKAVDDWLRGFGIELPLKRMPVDIFPSLNLPVIYVCQPYGGMDPAQMEGLLTNYYEYHFLYISGIHHVESRNVQGTSLMKLYFHSGTDMAQAMAETINYVNRSRAMMPSGTVPPFVMRFDTGSVPVGYLVLSSGTKTIAEIQDQALFKVRPMFSSLPGVSAPPPFGGSARSIVIRANPQRLQAYGLSPDDVIDALSLGNAVSPSGNIRLGDAYPIVPLNAMAKDLDDFRKIPIPVADGNTVYLRDIGNIEDAADTTTGYALVNGRRAVYILATKRADASTMSVIDEIKRALPSMQKELPDDIRVGFEFDQSPYVERAIRSLTIEGLLGAALTGLMVLLFLRDWRSALVVVLNIPIAIVASILGLWIFGETVNLMTLGGLALAVGILVDEATVEIENIHTQFAKSDSIAWAVCHGNAQTAVPRLMAMLCILAVFVPSFVMQGAPREMFAPLSLAVGFAMIASYLLSSTFVPVISIWLLRHQHGGAHIERPPGVVRRLYTRLVTSLIRLRWLTVSGYLVTCVIAIALLWPRLGMEIFPSIDAGEFRLRMRAPDGTHIDRTEELANQTLDAIKEVVGPENIRLTLGYVGTVPTTFPINSVYQFTRGPEEAILRIALEPKARVAIEPLKEKLREVLSTKLPKIRYSFEPSDIVSEVMSFGSPTPIEVAVRGGSMPENKAFLTKVETALRCMPALRDVQVTQSLEYPTVEVKVDREKAGLSGTTASQVARSIVAATSSSRFVVPNYWPDPKTGIGYQVQVEIPQMEMNSLDDLAAIPVKQARTPVMLRDVAEISSGTMPGEFDRYNMKRELTLTANIAGADLGRTSAEMIRTLNQVQRDDEQEKAALAKTGAKPGRVTYELRGQIPPLRQMLSGLGVGLLLAVVVIFLTLSANYQSFRLAIVTLSAAPAVLTGVLLMLWLSGSTLNIQSFIGTIMGLGVSMANAILLVTFANEHRRTGKSVVESAIASGAARLRPIAMTSTAMLAGMLPMALALGEAGQQTAPLGRAVIGGLAASTIATLFILPAVFALLQRSSTPKAISLDPRDPESAFHSVEATPQS